MGRKRYELFIPLLNNSFLLKYLKSTSELANLRGLNARYCAKFES
jgi:hypothetical protein